MIQKILATLLCAAAIVTAQDGIYGTFLAGFKYLDMGPINTTLNANPDLDMRGDFPNASLVFGGEGHIIIARRLVIGGMAFGRTNREELNTTTGTHPEGGIQFTGGVAEGFLGFNLLRDNRFGIHLYPRFGLGASTFILSRKIDFPDGSSQTFTNNLIDDQRSVVQKIGFALDPGIGLDWYKPFKNFFTIIPGLDVGIMMHIGAGFIIVPGQTNWFREVDQLDDYEPDVVYDGLYVNIGFGIGLSPK